MQSELASLKENNSTPRVLDDSELLDENRKLMELVMQYEWLSTNLIEKKEEKMGGKNEETKEGKNENSKELIKQLKSKIEELTNENIELSKRAMNLEIERNEAIETVKLAYQELQ